MKKFLSLALAVIMAMSLVTISAGAKDFTDDSSINYVEAVGVVSGIDVIDGYTDGSFNPSATLTRGAAAKIICNLVLGPTTASALGADTAPFPDVAANHTFAGYITYCAQQKIINGYPDGSFRPAGTVTGNQFMKMLLVALGYDGEVEGFTGANWSVSVAKLAVSLGLQDGNDEFVGTAAMTREEACLYAFNTLQANMVEYENKSTVVINGVTVNTGSTKAKDMENNSSSTDGNIENDDIMQFAEKYFTKLKMNEETDAFARPATTWRYKGDKVGTYSNTPDLTYAKNVKLGDVYSDLGMSEKDANAEVYFNGVQASDVVVSKGNTQKISSSAANNKLAGDGSMVEVYYDDDNNDVTICLIDVYVGEISNVVTNVSDPYVVIGCNSENGILDKAGSAVSFTSGKTHFETEETFDEETVVLFTYSQKDDEIQAVVAAESVEGTVNTITATKSVTLGETVYKYSKNIGFSMGTESGMTTKSDYKLYLDAEGMVIYVDEMEFKATDYAFVLNAESSTGTGFTYDRAKLVTAAGKLITVDTDDDYTGKVGMIVTYRQNSNGDYVLRSAPNQTRNGSTNTAGVIGGGDLGFYMQNSRAQIVLASTGGYSNVGTNTGKPSFNMGSPTSITQSVYANSETVIVVKDGGNSYSAYTGIKNAPTIYAATTGNAATHAVPFFGYVRGNNMLAFAFIDATNLLSDSGKQDILFLAGKESTSKMITDADGNTYYTYNAVKDGEITTAKVLATQDVTSVISAGAEVNGVYQNAQYNSDNIIKSADAVNTADYEPMSLTGVWKLSGSYTIGLGGSTASASARYSVASDAKIYNINTDGEITKVTMSEVFSNSSAKVIALLDKDSGDLAYIFIQEVDNGNKDDAGNNNTLSGLTGATYATGTVNVTLNGVNNGDSYTLNLQALNGGALVNLGSYTVTALAAPNANVTLPTGTLSAGLYRLSCGDFFVTFAV